MKHNKLIRRVSKVLMLILAAMLMLALLAGCGSSPKKVKLDPKNPVTVTVWHYYNGAIMNAFERLVKEFNETVGIKEGIIVEHYGMGNVTDLEKAVIASSKKEVGSLPMPSIFASYADTAYAAESLGLLANLDDYMSKDELEQYLDSYIEEGRIGKNGELRIFPIAKSTEIFMINETDWLPFAQATGMTYDKLSTMEELAEVAEEYYKWTDSQTPEPNDGKSFFGRDVMANLFIIASKQFGTDIFSVQNGEVTIKVNDEVMRKIWDYYYVPYISGYFCSYGRYRSDDAKVGDILAYVGSTSSAAYFPSEVTVDGKSYPVTAKVLPAPYFKNAEKVMVQQGAGMVVTKGDPKEEYAGTVFLKWFTETNINIEFSALSGYMPVKKEAVDYETFTQKLDERGYSIDDIARETLKISLNEIETSKLYTNKAFTGGTEARAVLETDLQSKAVADRESVLNLLQNGKTHEQAVSEFNTEEYFKSWLNDLTQKLNNAALK